MKSNVVRLHSNVDDIEWTNSFVICSLMQEGLFAELRAGVKQDILAARIGCCRATIHKLAYGETKEPTGRITLLVLRYLGYRVFIR